MKSLLLLYIAIDWNKTGVWVAILTLAVGLIALAIGLIKFVFKAGGIKKTIDILVDDIKEIKTDLKDFGIRFAITESRVNDLWSPKVTTQHSPKYLNENGKRILKESKFDELINNHYSEILNKVRELNPVNAYQAEQDIIKVVQRLVLDPECQNSLEISAFQTGQSVNTILFVGAIYIRDRIIKEIGLDVLDIDKFAPSSTNK